jgi:hypothetical protein
MKAETNHLGNAQKQIEKEIREACVFLREKNMTIPSDTIQFILDASLEKIKQLEPKVNELPSDEEKKFPDCNCYCDEWLPINEVGEIYCICGRLI